MLEKISTRWPRRYWRFSASRKIDLYDDPLLVRDLSRLTIVEKHFGHKLEAVSAADGHADRAIALPLPPRWQSTYPSAGMVWGGVVSPVPGNRGRALAIQFSSRRHIRHPHLKGLIYEQLP